MQLSQWIGVAMIASFLAGLVVLLIRDMGAKEALLGLIISVGSTAFLVLGVHLALGPI